MYLARQLSACLVAFGVLSTAHSQAGGDEGFSVVTALPVTYSLTSALTAGTSIRVRNLPERGRRINGLPNYFESQADRLADTFAAADAVVTIGKLWSDDPVYTAARSANIRIVDIDATKPWSTSLEGVSVAYEPVEDAPWLDRAGARPTAVPSIYFWLSPANGTRAAEIIARDLMRLAPDSAAAIEENLRRLRRELLDLKLEFELKLAVVPDVTVFSLAPEFVYLTSDMGLFVDGHFFKQDLDWTTADLEAFEAHLRTHAIGVVIHKWEPAEPILQAIEAAGARLAVLETLDAGIVVDGRLSASSYQDLLRQNLERVHAALSDMGEE